jgi:hypothetical protein
MLLLLLLLFGRRHAALASFLLLPVPKEFKKGLEIRF